MLKMNPYFLNCAEKDTFEAFEQKNNLFLKK
jgi:hypothetical protein